MEWKNHLSLLRNRNHQTHLNWKKDQEFEGKGSTFALFDPGASSFESTSPRLNSKIQRQNVDLSITNANCTVNQTNNVLTSNYDSNDSSNFFTYADDKESYINLETPNETFDQFSMFESINQSINLHETPNGLMTPKNVLVPSFDKSPDEDVIKHSEASSVKAKILSNTSKSTSQRIEISPTEDKKHSDFAKKLENSQQCDDSHLQYLNPTSFETPARHCELNNNSILHVTPNYPVPQSNEPISISKKLFFEAESWPEGDEWKEAYTQDGKKYYYNRKTRESHWRLPANAMNVKLNGITKIIVPKSKDQVLTQQEFNQTRTQDKSTNMTPISLATFQQLSSMQTMSKNIVGQDSNSSLLLTVTKSSNIEFIPFYCPFCGSAICRISSSSSTEDVLNVFKNHAILCTHGKWNKLSITLLSILQECVTDLLQSTTINDQNAILESDSVSKFSVHTDNSTVGTGSGSKTSYSEKTKKLYLHQQIAIEEEASLVSFSKHRPEGPFICENCPNVFFKTETSFIAHLQQCHLSKASESSLVNHGHCPFCNKNLRNKSELSSHLLSCKKKKESQLRRTEQKYSPPSLTPEKARKRTPMRSSSTPNTGKKLQSRSEIYPPTTTPRKTPFTSASRSKLY